MHRLRVRCRVRKRVRLSVRVPTIYVVFRCEVLGRSLAGTSRCCAGQSPVAIEGGKSYKGWGGSDAFVKVLVSFMVRGYLVLAISARAFGWQCRVGWQVLRVAAITSGVQGVRFLQGVGRYLRFGEDVGKGHGEGLPCLGNLCGGVWLARPCGMAIPSRCASSR